MLLLNSLYLTMENKKGSRELLDTTNSCSNLTYRQPMKMSTALSPVVDLHPLSDG